jgi:hypothetical protein
LILSVHPWAIFSRKRGISAQRRGLRKFKKVDGTGPFIPSAAEGRIHIVARLVRHSPLWGGRLATVSVKTIIMTTSCQAHQRVFATITDSQGIQNCYHKTGSSQHLVNPPACYSKNGYLRRDSLLLERRFRTIHVLSSESKQTDSPNVAMSHKTLPVRSLALVSLPCRTLASRPLRYLLTPPHKHGQRYAGQLSVKKQSGFSAHEWQHLLLPNSAPSGQQRPDFTVALWQIWW